MIHSNIGSKVLPTVDKGVKKAALSPTLVCQDGKDKEGALEAQINTLSKVDPLAYYCALVLIDGMDELLAAGGYCRVGNRRYSELGATLRAWDWLEPEEVA